jgi:uncharacterized glyoxalase superfamily protein PhnB
MPKGIPPDWHSVTPRLVVDDPHGMVEFLKNVFGAGGEYAGERPSVVRIGDSHVMVSGREARPATAAFLYVYVEDVDATYERALQCGASSVEAPADLPYGDRRAMVADRFGNTWQIAMWSAGR